MKQAVKTYRIISQPRVTYTHFWVTAKNKIEARKEAKKTLKELGMSREKIIRITESTEHNKGNAPKKVMIF